MHLLMGKGRRNSEHCVLKLVLLPVTVQLLLRSFITAIFLECVILSLWLVAGDERGRVGGV